MEQATLNFILVVLGFVIQAIFLVLGYFFKSTLARQEESVKNLGRELMQDAANLESWKLTYVERHAEIRARLASLEGVLNGSLGNIQATMNKLASEVPVVCNRLDNIERSLKGKGVNYP